MSNSNLTEKLKHVLTNLLDLPDSKSNGKYTKAAKEKLLTFLPAVFENEINIVETYDLNTSRGSAGVLVLCKLDGKFTQIMLTEKMLMFIPIPDEYTKIPTKKKAVPNPTEEKPEEEKQPVPEPEPEVEPETKEAEIERDLIEEMAEDQEDLPFVDDTFEPLDEDEPFI